MASAFSVLPPEQHPTSMISRHDRAQAGRIRLSLLAGFELRLDGAVVPLVMGAKRLLAFLGVHERALPRTCVAETLWLDVSDRRAWANLRSALWRLGDLRHRIVEQAGDHLMLTPDVDVDIREADTIVSELLAGRRPDVAFIDQRLFEGELLPGWCEEWLTVARERHHQRGLLALEVLCERLSGEGHYHRAVSAGLAAVAGDPLRESAHSVLIGAHIAAGNVTEAVRQFERFERLIKDEMGLPPSQQLQHLVSGLW